MRGGRDVRFVDMYYMRICTIYVYSICMYLGQGLETLGGTHFVCGKCGADVVSDSLRGQALVWEDGEKIDCSRERFEMSTVGVYECHDTHMNKSYMHICIYVHMCVCIYLYIHGHKCMCVFGCIYIYMYMYDRWCV